MIRRLRFGITCLLGATGLVTPAMAGPPYITDDPEPVEYQHWEVYLFSTGAQSANETSGIGPSVEVNYGVLPNLQLHVIGGLSYDEPAGQPLRIGVGDTELGAKYRFVTPGTDDWFPQIAVFPLLEVPTGNAARGLGAGYTQAFLPIWIQKDFGKWTTYGGGGYWINPGAGNRNYWFTGLLVQRQLTDQLATGVEVFHQTSSEVGRGAAWGFNIGAVYDVTEHYHLLASAGDRGSLNATEGANINRTPFAYYVGFQWTF